MAYVARKTLTRARALRQKLTDAEAILWYRLRQLPDLRFRRQHPVGPFIADSACVQARLIIELDGATHSTEEERGYDARRDAYLRKRGWQILRIANCNIYENSDEVVCMICDAATARIQNRSR